MLFIDMFLHFLPLFLLATISWPFLPATGGIGKCSHRKENCDICRRNSGSTGGMTGSNWRRLSTEVSVTQVAWQYKQMSKEKQQRASEQMLEKSAEHYIRRERTCSKTILSAVFFVSASEQGLLRPQDTASISCWLSDKSSGIKSWRESWGGGAGGIFLDTGLQPWLGWSQPASTCGPDTGFWGNISVIIQSSTVLPPKNRRVRTRKN